ncbi:MAG: HEAT repeat domain-containing protein, partial [Acidobacteria bacterium]|nr:HEAT repeat domain-containing protein [Acidobacteriota bacterium]
MRHRSFLKPVTLAFLTVVATAPASAENRRSPGPVCRQPAVEGLRISNDRWPDSFTLRSFAEDAIRLARARTPEEEALALYDWIARVMTIGGSPHEGPPGQEVYAADTLKILNVYGNHWCDGQARIFETLWRSLGRQARRLYLPMRHHSLVELWWRDADGQGRWHALDVNNGWWVRNERGWISSSEDLERNPLLVLAANQDLKMRAQGWLHTHLSSMPEHSMAIHLRRGESYTLRWDNQGFYYVNPRTRQSVAADSPLYEPGGPYSQFIGGGEVVFVPDLSSSTWSDDLWGEVKNVRQLAGHLEPEAAGEDSAFVYQFDFPHLIVDATVEATVVRSSPEAEAAISFSVDGGKSWHSAWAATELGLTHFLLNLGRERGNRGLPSVQGFYSFLLRFEMRAAERPGDVSISDLSFTHRTMMNKMTLPNLAPGWNRFKVAARKLAAGHSLRVVVEWSDKEGVQRLDRVARQLPYEFDLFANGSGGSTVGMGSLKLEPVRLDDEQPSSLAARVRSGAAEDRFQAIIEAGLRGDGSMVGPLLEEFKSQDPEVRFWAADALGKVGSPEAVPALVLGLHDEFEAIRMVSAIALGELKRKEAVPALLEVAMGKAGPGKGYRLFIPVDVGAARWAAARALGRIGDRSAVPALAELLETADGDLGFFVAQALGELGDRRAVPA